MKTYQLTRHFALNEFTRSATAIANGIDNSLDLAKADDRMVADSGSMSALAATTAGTGKPA